MTDSPDWIGAVSESAPLLVSAIERVFTLGAAPGVVTFTTALTGGTRSIRLFACRLELKPIASQLVVATPIVGHLEETTSLETLAVLRISGSKLADTRAFDPSFVLPVGKEVDMNMGTSTAAFLDPAFGTTTSMTIAMSILYQIV